MNVCRNEHVLDLQLARAILSGEIEAWHEFVLRYSGLILSLVRRYLAEFDDETQRTGYVDVLRYMYRTGLRKYDGRAALSTWVMAITRSRALDARRALVGRHRRPAWVAGLKAREREIFQLYFERGEAIEAILERFAARGEPLTRTKIARTLVGLEARMDPRLRSRLAYDLHVLTTGGLSGSLAGLVDHLRRQKALAEEALRPDLLLLERQTRVQLHRIRQLVEQLDPLERKIVELHYYQGLAAPQIAQQLHLTGPRRVYTLIDRTLAHLRVRFEARDGSSPRQRRINGGPT